MSSLSRYSAPKHGAGRFPDPAPIRGHKKQLRQLANRMADQVTRTGKRVTMEPMPSSERRVVHIELRGHPAVITESTGDDPYRKVVILPKE